MESDEKTYVEWQDGREGGSKPQNDVPILRKKCKKDF